MLAKGLIGTAVLVYLAVLGCVLLPGDAPGAKKLSIETPTDSAAAAAAAANGNGVAVPPARNANWREGLPYRGAGMQIQRVDWIDRYSKR